MPRAIVGYISEKEWAFIEFLCFMHASWRYVTSMAAPTGMRLDLVVFSEARWLREAASICEPLEVPGAGAAGDQAAQEAAALEKISSKGSTSTCWVVYYPKPPASVWHNYPFIQTVHFLADPRVGRLLTASYGYLLKTDLDCFITATLIHHFPQQLEVGHMVYVTVPETAARVKQVADRLGLQHRGVHNAGPTWYGDAATVVAVGNLSVPVLYHLLDEHFEKNPDGTWRQNWAQGEGWPLWSKDIAALYASELVLNGLVQHWEVSDRYDAHGDTERYTFSLYHIHAQHGDRNFSKFEFFKHKYQDRDINTGLDFHLVKDYTLWLAVSTWRHVQELMLHKPQAAGAAAAGGQQRRQQQQLFNEQTGGQQEQRQHTGRRQDEYDEEERNEL